MTASLYLPAHAQGPGSYVLPFLIFSPSAVANGMGGGSVAASTEASAIYYNPAALTRLGGVALAGNVFKLFPDFPDNNARYHHFAGALQSRQLWFGIAHTRLGYGKQIVTGEGSPEPIAEFEPYDSALSLAVAGRLGQRTRFGIGFKYVRSVFQRFEARTNLKEEAASTYAVDLGFLYEGFLSRAHLPRQFLRQPLPWQKWLHQGLPPGFSFGIALANAGPKIKYIVSSQADPLPQNLRLGVAWNMMTSDVFSLIATGEWVKILIKTNRNGAADGALKALFTAWRDKNFRDELSEATYSGGFEVNVLNLAALRWGRSWNGTTSFGYNTFGYSLGLPNLRFSYTKFTPFESFLIDEWRIYTVALVFNKLP